MKKILFLLLLVITLGACESDTDSNWNNRPGGGSNETQNWDSYTITVKNWERIGGVNENNSYFPQHNTLHKEEESGPAYYHHIESDIP